MRILACADIHGRRRVVDHIIYASEEYSPDVVVVAGDITHFGTPEEVKEILNEIPGEVLAIPGNCDPRSSVKGIEESKAKNLHGKCVNIKGVVFFGVGGSNITPFRTFFELSEGELRKILLASPEKVDILVTHSPPFGILDEVRSGIHAGSREIRRFSEEKKPKLHVFGHIHEARGVERLGGITYVNVTCGHLEGPAILDLEEEVKVIKI